MSKILLMAISLVLILTGCKNGSKTQAEVNPGNRAAQNSATAGASPAAPKDDAVSQRGLTGVYTISEVDHQLDNKNVADMIPSHREIQFTFRPDGSFKRVARKVALIHLTETGTFKIEEPDQLVLSPSIVNDKKVTDGRTTTYKFSLSPDGDELKLLGARGNVAVFHRTEKL